MLRRLLALALVALPLVSPHRAAADTLPYVRILDRELKARFEAGVERSPTLRALLAQVADAGSILVFVDCNMLLPTAMGARLNFVTSVAGLRYVRVAIDCTLVPRQQIALIAHEVQHALEIGNRPDIVDVDAMESFYEEIGFNSSKDGAHKRFETTTAIAIQRLVYRELGDRHRKTSTSGSESVTTEPAPE